ncbi:MAG TPA: hypothetical protein H9739_08205 [Candidatus Agathobaculum pullistercoris]|nr:hypothetical protein [uncultured Agathobaculum sp.]HIX11549.1 hypothetical protein [Candidatus Agathobaculum pullistercoris]
MSEKQQPLDEEQAASAAEKELASAQAMPAEPDSRPSADSDTLADGLAADEGNSEIPAEEDADISDDESEYEEDISDEEEEEEDIDPADVRILGMPRVCFHLAASGVAVGYIACGLVGLLADSTKGTAIGDLAAKSPSATVWVIIFAVIGYLIGNRMHKKRLAAQEAELAEQAAENPEG